MYVAVPSSTPAPPVIAGEVIVGDIDNGAATAGCAAPVDLDRNFTIQFRIAPSIDFTHAAGTDGSDDLIRSEASTGTEGHLLCGSDARILARHPRLRQTI
jgi:hypothetical protein